VARPKKDAAAPAPTQYTAPSAPPAEKPKRSRKPAVAETKNLPAVRKSTLPANWEAEMAKDAANTAANEAKVATGRFFSTKAGILTYQGNPIKGGSMDVVILGSLFERRLYKPGTPFDENNPTSPICYSFSEDGDDMEPHEESFDKQNPTCKGCWADAWGTADEGRRKGKACGEVRRLALLPADSLKNVDAIEKGEFGFLRVPVTSVSAWASFAKALAASQTKPPYCFITTITVQPDAKKQVAVTFAVKSEIKDKKSLEAIWKRRQQALDEIVQPYPEYVEPAAPAPRKGGRKPKY
jgi:hypothetical protein